MRNFARIENNLVREIFDLDEHHPGRPSIAGLFHPALNWQPAPAGCQEGWVVHEGEILAPDNYKILRSKEYPSIMDLIDGLVKEHASDPSVSSEGATQTASYYTAALAVKTKYPKPV